MWGPYRTEGDAGLVHRRLGQPGARRKPPSLRAKILARYAERYSDFGPTVAAEYLAQEKLVKISSRISSWFCTVNSFCCHLELPDGVFCLNLFRRADPLSAQR